MPRSGGGRSGGGRAPSRPSAPAAPSRAPQQQQQRGMTTTAPPPARAQQPPAQAGQSPGLFGQMASTAAFVTILHVFLVSMLIYTQWCCSRIQYRSCNRRFLRRWFLSSGSRSYPILRQPVLPAELHRRLRPAHGHWPLQQPS